jgi:hypothetical protein
MERVAEHINWSVIVSQSVAFYAAAQGGGFFRGSFSVAVGRWESKGREIY